MSGPRVSRSYKVFKDNVFYREFSSRAELARYMRDNHFPNFKLDYIYISIISLYPRGGQKSYHGFTFEKDPSWVGSKRTRAFNEDTNHQIITESRGKMCSIFFEKTDRNAGPKMSRLIKSGGSHGGYKFEDIPVGYVGCSGGYGVSVSKPVIGTDVVSGEVILCLSMTDGARHVMRKLRASGNVLVVRSNIRKAVSNYMGGSDVVYGYRWTYPE